MSEEPIVIALVTQKGGAGKTTILTNLAVAAASKGAKVVALDADPQESLNTWWQDREKDDIDCVLVKPDEAHLLADARTRFAGYDFVFIDTPAQAENINGQAIRSADFCILPCRPAMADMRAQKVTAQMIDEIGKPASFVVSCSPTRGTRGIEAKRSLGVYGLPVAELMVSHLVAYQDAYSLGLGVMELEPDGKAAREIKFLWAWVQSKMEKLS